MAFCDVIITAIIEAIGRTLTVGPVSVWAWLTRRPTTPKS